MNEAVRPTLAERWPARSILSALADTGEVFLLMGQIVRELPFALRKFGLVVNQMASIGIGSIQRFARR